jgi:hypothetical protein
VGEDINMLVDADEVHGGCGWGYANGPRAWVGLRGLIMKLV